MAWTDMTQLTGLVAWYKPETLAATYANGDPISTWADSSGNSRDLTGTTTTRPLAAANAIGTYMAADFDGTDDVLEHTTGYSFTSAPLAVCIVQSFDSFNTYSGLVSVDDSYPVGYPNSHMGLRVDNNTSYVNYAQGVNGTYYAARLYLTVPSAASVTTGASDGTFGYCTGTNGVVSLNAQTNFSANPAVASGTIYWMIGNSGYGMPLNGKIAEVVMWASSNWHSERFWVEGYLANKYSITLADGHLFKNAAPENAPTTYNAAGSTSYALPPKHTRL